jgi:hypothetical protein
MRAPLAPLPIVTLLVAAALLSLGLIRITAAQSQEPKPVLPATPVAEADVAPIATPLSGVAATTWEGPNWGVRVTWDPADWTVENEFIQTGYDGLQIGTPRSTAYIEAFARFDGDADACLAEAEAEIAERPGVVDVLPISGRPLPVPAEEADAARMYGVTATLADGTIYRGVEYVECRTLVPGEAVVEITWQVVTGAFDEDLPLVQELFAAIELPDTGAPAATPVA